MSKMDFACMKFKICLNNPEAIKRFEEQQRNKYEHPKWKEVCHKKVVVR